jgi:hypothetical protein
MLDALTGANGQLVSSLDLRTGGYFVLIGFKSSTAIEQLWHVEQQARCYLQGISLVWA